MDFKGRLENAGVHDRGGDTKRQVKRQSSPKGVEFLKEIREGKRGKSGEKMFGKVKKD